MFLKQGVLFHHAFSCRYLVLDIADNPVENIIRFFPMVSEEVGRVFWESSLALKGVAFTIKFNFPFYRLKNSLMAA